LDLLKKTQFPPQMIPQNSQQPNLPIVLVSARIKEISTLKQRPHNPLPIFLLIQASRYLNQRFSL
jgi:hypothetical protein